MTNKEYRKVWCDKHGLSEDFAKECAAVGFEIHHVDGNRSNNDPSNLVMIYRGDHIYIHGGEPYQSKGKRAYELRKKGLPWKEIGNSTVINAAKWYAIHNKLMWPLPRPNPKRK